MTERDNVIQILFGVAGGSSISGESGQQIQRDLTELSKNLRAYVNIDEDHFKAQLNKLKRDMEDTLGKLKIDLAVGKTSVTGKDSLSSSNATKNIQKQSDAYDNLRKKITDTANAEKILAKEIDVTTKKYDAQKKIVERMSGELKETQKNISADIVSGNMSEEEAHRAKILSDSLAQTAQRQNELTQAMRNDRVINSMAGSYEKLRAKINNLNNQYDWLITHNADAAKIMANLNQIVDEGYKGIRTELDKDGNLVTVYDYEAATNQIREMTRESAKASGTLAEMEAQSKTLGRKLQETFSSKIIQTFSYALIGFGVNALSQVYRNVVQLDSAITDLQIATGKTREETAALVRSYGELAQTLGSTISEVSSGADTWLRQGYSVAETNQLITDSMMLAKLGQLDAAEASKALTSAMKGYGVAVEDAMGIVDKFTAVDMEAAVSAGGIATAMAETAAGAKLAGISMDELIGQIAVVAEVTQDGEESVGNFFKTLYARMGNVKAGKFIDDETGESLNDVEKVLSKLGIELRDSEGLFRNFGDVLDEVGAKWDSYDTTQQRALATAFAGKCVPVRTEMCA